MFEVAGIAEAVHPGEIIVRRVIDPLHSAEAPIERRDAEVVVEPGEVAAAAEVPHLRLEAVGGRGLSPPHGIDAPGISRGRHLHRGATEHPAQRRRGRGPESATGGDRVLVQVRHRRATELGLPALDVLRGAHESPLLGIPGREDERTLWTVAAAHRFPPRPRRLEHAHRAADVVPGARTPRVAVGPDDDCLIRKGGTADGAEGVVDPLVRRRTGLEPDGDVRGHRAIAAEVIVDAEASLPRIGDGGTAES